MRRVLSLAEFVRVLDPIWRWAPSDCRAAWGDGQKQSSKTKTQREDEARYLKAVRIVAQSLESQQNERNKGNRVCLF